MEEFKNQLLAISEGKYTNEQLVSILVVCASELEIDTISEIARKENKTPRGVLISNNYRKVKIGKQMFAVIGLSDSRLPF